MPIIIVIANYQSTAVWKASPGLVLFSGGQSGVDRATLDIARQRGIAVTDWCPAGGRAEDFSQAPGLLTTYHELTPTPSCEYQQRTEWNVRDSQGTMVLLFHSGDLRRSPGTRQALEYARQYQRPLQIINLRAPGALDSAQRFFQRLGPAGPVNIAGPRESQVPGIYDAAERFLRRMLN